MSSVELLYPLLSFCMLFEIVDSDDNVWCRGIFAGIVFIWAGEQ